MKKLISLLLVVIILLSSGVIPVVAVEEQYRVNEPKFKKEFGEPLYYKELTYYSDLSDDEVIEWYLIEAYTQIDDEHTDTQLHSNCFVNGDLVIHSNKNCKPFKSSYGVYDVWNGDFFDLAEVDIEDYFWLRQRLLELGIATLHGNIDGDKVVSILDATLIQQVIAKISDSKIETCMGDMNGDNGVDILDATSIQKILAKFEESPYINHYDVRYLSLMPFSYETAEEMPVYVRNVEFETKANYIDLPDYTQRYPYSHCVTYYDNLDNFQYIVKSLNSYNNAFNEKAPQFDDEFFKDNWLVVTMSTCDSSEYAAPITALGVYGEILYIRANPDTVSSAENESTGAPQYISMVAVDKKLLYKVKKIVRVK